SARIASLQRDDAERVLCRGDARIDLERAAEQLLRARQVPPIQPYLANLILDERVLRIEREVVLEPRQRRVVVAEPAIGLREVEHREVVIRFQAECPLEIL